MMTNKTGPPPCRSERLQVMMSHDEMAAIEDFDIGPECQASRLRCGSCSDAELLRKEIDADPRKWGCRARAPRTPARSEAVRDRPGPTATAGQRDVNWLGTGLPILNSRQRLCLEETMSRFLADIMLSLANDRQHMQESVERVIKSSADHGKLQERIGASQLLIQRAQTRWPTRIPTLPRPSARRGCQSVSADNRRALNKHREFSAQAGRKNRWTGFP
jgi:hypothetical protein